MLLQGIHEGRVYASRNRLVTVETVPGTFSSRGRLPNPERGLAAFRYRFLTSRGWKWPVSVLFGHFRSATVERVDDENFVATAGRHLFVSDDGARTWSVADSLPASSGPMGVLPTGLSSYDGSVYLGEYPLGESTTPRVCQSDDGRRWETVTELAGVRHIHAVTTDPFTGDLWVTTGDTDAECQIGRLRDGEFRPVGGGSQRWRAVDLAFTPSSILWGMDCSYAEENLLLKLPRTALDDASPSPEVVNTLPSSVFYAASWSVDGTQWVAFSTAVETTPDSTADDSDVRTADRARVVAASGASEFTDWLEVCSYRPARVLADVLPLPSANTYLYLAADDERGLVVNPYNTATNHGRVVEVTPCKSR